MISKKVLSVRKQLGLKLTQMLMIRVKTGQTKMHTTFLAKKPIQMWPLWSPQRSQNRKMDAIMTQNYVNAGFSISRTESPQNWINTLFNHYWLKKKSPKVYVLMLLPSHSSHHNQNFHTECHCTHWDNDTFPHHQHNSRFPHSDISGWYNSHSDSLQHSRITIPYLNLPVSPRTFLKRWTYTLVINSISWKLEQSQMKRLLLGKWLVNIFS
jgi:hypothetical protein